jgi:O-antigen ligase
MKALFCLDPSGRILSPADKVLYGLMAAFFISLYLSPMDYLPVVNNLCTAALMAYTLWRLGIKAWWATIVKRPLIWAWVLFMVWNTWSALQSGNTEEGHYYLHLRIALLIFPLSVGTWSLDPKFKDRLYYCYAAVTVLASLACLTDAFIRYRQTGETQWLYDDSLSQLSSIQSVYFSLMVEVAIFCLGYLTVKRTSLASRAALIAGIVFLLVIQFMLSSRTGIVYLYTSALCLGGWYLVIKQRRYKEALLGLGAVLLMGGALICFFPKTLNRFHELAYTDYRFNSQGREAHYNMELTPDQWNGANIRLAIWRCAWDVASHHLWTGIPVGDKKDSLVAAYQARGFTFAVRSRRNTHSTYVDVLLTFGIGGLLLFMGAFIVVPLLNAVRNRQVLTVLVIGAITLAMVTETYLDRSLGVTLLGFFVWFFSDYPPGTSLQLWGYPRNTPGYRAS